MSCNSGISTARRISKPFTYYVSHELHTHVKVLPDSECLQVTEEKKIVQSETGPLLTVGELGRSGRASAEKVQSGKTEKE